VKPAAIDSRRSPPRLFFNAAWIRIQLLPGDILSFSVRLLARPRLRHTVAAKNKLQ